MVRSKPIAIPKLSTKRFAQGKGGVGVKRIIRLTGLNKFFSKKTFSKKRARSNSIYLLLIASILFTVLNAVMTCSLIKKKEMGYGSTFHGKTLFLQHSAEFNPVWLLSFVVLALTCSLALVTIAKKDKSNARLLSKLRLSNRQLEGKVRKRTSELAEAIRAKDHFLGIATHDLKAPLSGILGLVELIKMGNRSMPASEAEYLGHIEYSCKKMQRLIHDILEINRIEQGKAIVKKEKVDLARLANELRRNFAREAERKSIHLMVEDADGTLETDADSLTRILENLLSNAIKFSLPLKKVRLHASLQQEHVLFEVEDEGPGIPIDEQPKLFNKFQRLSNRPTSSEMSTGLGLSIVKELTTQLGGEITFSSAVGKGTTFFLTFPR